MTLEVYTIYSALPYFLTDAGLEIAVKIYERHCFLKEQLIAAGIESKTAEKEACRMEHAISQESFEHLKNVYQDQGEQFD